MGCQQGTVFSSIVSTYTPIEYINEDSRAPSLQKRPARGTGDHLDVFDRLRRPFVYVSREQDVHRCRQNQRHGFRFRVHADNFCRQCWCVWHLCRRPLHSGKLLPCSCVLRVSVYRAYWKMLGTGVCVACSAAWSQSSKG